MSDTKTLARRDPYTDPASLPSVAKMSERPLPAAAYPMRDLLTPYRAQIEGMLPAGVTFDRIVAELYQCAVRTPKLLEVPAELLIPEVCRALSTEGVIGQDVYLVPFWNSKASRTEVSTIVDYKYKAALVQKAGGAKVIEARAVYAKERFSVRYGTNAAIEHEPLSPGARGPLIGAYAIAHIGAYTTTFHWAPLEEVEEIRAKSKQWSERQGVKACPAWYAKKTAVNQLVKLLPKSPRMRAVASLIEAEEQREFGAPLAVAPLPEEDDTPALPPDVSPDGEDLTYEPEQDDDVVVTVALDVALAMKVNGQVLGESRNNGLRAIAKWARSKMDETDTADAASVHRLQTIAAACDVILAARERGEIQEPAKAPKEAA